MIDWLYNLPEAALLVIPAATLALLVVFLPRFLQRLPWLAPSDANTDFVIRMQATLFTLTSLLLAFTLVQADINFRQADSLVAAEAARIDQFDRLLTRYGEQSARDVRPLLRAYALSIIHDEWPEMLNGNVNGNAATSAAFTPVSRHILAIDPETTRQGLILAEMLKSLDAIAEARAARLNTVGLGLPIIYWQVVLFALAGLIVVSCTIQQTAFRTSVLAIQVAVIGAFVGFVFIMDQPFKGDTAVGPDSFVQILARMERRVY